MEAAARSPSIKRLVLYEPPYMAEASGPQASGEYGKRLGELLSAGRKGEMVELFLSTIGLPAQAIAGIRKASVWTLMESIAPTLASDNALLGNGSVPRERTARVRAPTLVLTGSSPEVLRVGAKRTAEAIPQAQFRTLEGQTHDVSAEALAPVLTEFLG